jgi:hypothetical protein
MLAAEGLGLMLNPEVAPSFMVLPPDALAWLAATLAARPGEAEARPVSVAPPAGVPDALLAALDANSHRHRPRPGGLARGRRLCGRA